MQLTDASLFVSLNLTGNEGPTMSHQALRLSYVSVEKKVAIRIFQFVRFHFLTAASLKTTAC
jgi:hypothetical protein